MRKGALVTAMALLLLSLAPLAAVGSGSTLYLDGDSVPTGQLDTSSPVGPFDARLLAKSGEGVGETDPSKFQAFSVDGPFDTEADVSLTISVKVKDDHKTKVARFHAYLLECSSSSCSTLASASKALVPGGPWKQTTLQFDEVELELSSSRDLVLKIVVANDSDDDLWFAWGGSAHRSRVVIGTPPPTTTTTTATPTTVPSTTTTSTNAPPTTTTTSPTTTVPSHGSTAPGESVAPGAGEGTTSTTSSTTTTTTSPGGESQGEESGSAGEGQPPSEVQVSGVERIEGKKEGLVIRTTPTQRGMSIAGSSLELTPVEGLMVSFLTAAETIRGQLVSAAVLGLLMTVLLLIGVAKREDEGPSDIG